MLVQAHQARKSTWYFPLDAAQTSQPHKGIWNQTPQSGDATANLRRVAPADDSDVKMVGGQKNVCISVPNHRPSFYKVNYHHRRSSSHLLIPGPLFRSIPSLLAAASFIPSSVSLKQM